MVKLTSNGEWPASIAPEEARPGPQGRGHLKPRLREGCGFPQISALGLRSGRGSSLRASWSVARRRPLEAKPSTRKVCRVESLWTTRHAMAQCLAAILAHRRRRSATRVLAVALLFLLRASALRAEPTPAQAGERGAAAPAGKAAVGTNSAQKGSIVAKNAPAREAGGAITPARGIPGTSGTSGTLAGSIGPSNGGTKGSALPEQAQVQADGKLMARSAAKAGPGSQGIPGSRISTNQGAAKFRAKWRCLTSSNTSRWKWDPTPRPLAWLNLDFPKGCDQKPGWLGLKANAMVRAGNFTNSSWPVNDGLKYVWAPQEEAWSAAKCGPSPQGSLSRFNAGRFCTAVRRRGGSLFIVGDSISDGLRKALLAELRVVGVAVRDTEGTPGCKALKDSFAERRGMRAGQLPDHLKHLCASHLICGSRPANGSASPAEDDGDGVWLHFVVSMFLRRVHGNEKPWQMNLFENINNVPELAWGREMLDHNASIVILNRGAHFIRHNFHEVQLKRTLQELRKMFPNLLIIYRATAAAHPNCTGYTAPVTTPLNMTRAGPLAWSLFQAQNEVAKAIVESSGVRGVFWDVYPMTALRPDAHPGWHDCLHYCLPGPVSDWVRMLGRMLDDLV